jgi:CRP-like cAMP-binding protein
VHHKVVVPVPAPQEDNAVASEQFNKTPLQKKVLCRVVEDEIPQAMDAGAIVDLMYLITVPKAQTDIVVQGEASDKMYILETGEVGIYSQDFVDRPPELEHCKRAGECFGVWSVLYSQPGPFTMRTHEEDVSLWVLPRSKFLELITGEQRRLLGKKARLLEKVWLLARYLGALFESQLHCLLTRSQTPGCSTSSRIPWSL